MYAQGSKCLSSSLTEADVAQFVRFGNLKNMIYGVWNVVPCEIVDTNGGIQYRHNVG